MEQTTFCPACGRHRDDITFGSEDDSVGTRFVPCQRFSRWTFDAKAIRRWVESRITGRTLNACCGKNTLDHDAEVVRNDLHPERDADHHLDVAELAAHFEAGSFDTIVFDPPWSLYQSNLRYDGYHVTKSGDVAEVDIDLSELPFETPGPEEKSQLGHARLAKENFDYLLSPGGLVIEITHHGTCMPSRLGYARRERVIFDPIGEGKAVIGSVDQKQ